MRDGRRGRAAPDGEGYPGSAVPVTRMRMAVRRAAAHFTVTASTTNTSTELGGTEPYARAP